MKEDKHYLSIYYGIDETLPDDIFYCRVKEINQECEKHIQKFNKSIEIAEQSVIYQYGVRENTLIKHT